MRKTREFREFVQQKYEGGKAQIPHPDPERRKKRPTVKFWTAMKYDTFKQKVKREFEAWRQEQEAQRPRRQVGERIRQIAELREGDFVQGRWQSDRYKVVKVTPKAAQLIRVDEFGRPEGTKKYRWTDSRLRGWRGRLTRMDDLKRPEVPLDQVREFLKDLRPGRDINSQADYREYLRENLMLRHGPYRRLGEDEPEHKKRLEEQIDEILKERGIGKDWKWEPPPQVAIGEYVRHGHELREGDFIDRRGYKYRVLEIKDDGTLKAQRVDEHGRPIRDPEQLTRHDLAYGNARRIEPVKRKEVSSEEAKKFADDHIGFPEREVGDHDAYRKWVTKQFLENSESPFYALGEDEEGYEKHKKELDKAVDKLLKARKIGKDWKWQPPPHAEMGARVHDPYQLHVGDWFSQREDYAYRVLEVLDDGRVRAQRFERRNGRPQGAPIERDRAMFKRHSYKRVEPVERPKPSESDIKSFLDQHAYEPGRSVRTHEKYRQWLHDVLVNSESSPFYQLGEDETEHKKLLDAAIKKTLKERGIGKDWTWTPPPAISFPADKDWEKAHDATRKIALGGEHVEHPGANSPSAPPRPRHGDHDEKDRHLGGGINAADIRRMKGPDGEYRDYVFKSKKNEHGAGRMGAPPGTLHLREQAAYGLDRLLGDGIITPPTVSDGTGSYQEFRDTAHSWKDIKNRRTGMAKGMARHADVQRMLFLDEIMGHEDRHYGNLMYSLVDPDKPATPENMRVISIDNGYAFADPDEKHSANDFTTVACYDCLPFADRVYSDVLDSMPEELHKKIKQIKIPELLKSLRASGITSRGSLMATAARIMALQDNPDVIGKFLSQARNHDSGRKEWRYLSAKEPEKLFRDYTDLPASAYDDLVKMVDEATG